jgi:hypothetical protein
MLLYRDATQPTILAGPNRLQRQCRFCDSAQLAFVTLDSALRLDPALSCLAAMAAPGERCAGRIFGHPNLSGKDESDTAAGRVPLRTAQLVGAEDVEALVLRSATLRFLQVPWTASVHAGAGSPAVLVFNGFGWPRRFDFGVARARDSVIERLEKALA